MTILTWNDSFELKQPQMDATHREFVALLGAFEAALDTALPGDELAACFARLLEHTERHFAQEERWMAALGFEADNCHALQHAQLLHTLRQVPALIDEGDDAQRLRLLVQHLGGWFPTHAYMMDGALAEVMAERGFDPLNGARDRQPALAAGSGGAHCA